MAVRAGGKVSGVRYAGSKTYVPISVPNVDIPILAVVETNGFTLSYTPSASGILSVIVTSLAANQPSNEAFDASAEKHPVTSNSAEQLIHTSFGDADNSRVWVQLNTGSQRITTNVTVQYIIDSIANFFAVDH